MSGKVGVTVPDWIVEALGVERVMLITREVIGQCKRAGLSKREAVSNALTTLEANAEVEVGGAQ